MTSDADPEEQKAGVQGGHEGAATGPPPRAPGAPSPADYHPLNFADARGGWTSSVWWLFLPVVLLMAFAVWQRTERHGMPSGIGEPDAPDSLTASAIVDGWSARVEGDGDSPDLALRLEPLHPVATRQAFDAVALAARFRAGESVTTPDAQPWRLTVVATAVATVAAGDAAVIDSLSGVSIEGLEPLVPRAGAVIGEALTDPLTALLRFPEASLRPGETCDLVFWGPRPGPEVIVSAPGLSSATVLRQLARSTSPSSGAIARLDATGGATGDSGSRPR